MSRVGFGVLLMLSASTASATVPSQFSVQGVLRDGSGQLQSSTVNVTITLYDAQTAGNKLAGSYGPTSVAATNGLFTETITDANLDTELASASAVWMEMVVGNDTYPRQLVTPELFALHSSHSDNSDNLGGKAASAYLTAATAASTYETQAAMSSYLTVAAAASTYEPQSAMSSYLTTNAAASTYQTQSGMSNYLTTSAASSTYELQSSMSNYLTTSAAASTYEPQSAMSSYLTTSAAASTYQAKGSYVDLSSTQTMTGVKEFTGTFDPGTIPNNTVAVGIMHSQNNFGADGICAGGYFGGTAACMGAGTVSGTTGWFWGVVANSSTTNKTMTLDGNGNLYTSGTYSSGSSAKLKKDIHYLDPSEQDGALKMVLDTPIATYRYKRSSEQSKPVYGVIAETTPSPMLTDDNQGVNLTNTVGVLLASVKAQQARIAELQARLDKLEKHRGGASHHAAAVAAPLQ